MSLPLISVALCTYNGEKFLEEQIDSVLRQTYPNLEIVIVDDCSNDKSLEIIKEFATHDDRIKIVRNTKNIGFNKNFEKALSLSSGEYIAICDQDDVWIATKIEELYHRIGDNWLIFSNSSLINPEGEQLRGNLLNDFHFNNCTYKAFLLKNFVTGHTSLLKKDFLNCLLPIPLNGYYDWYMGFVASYHNKLVYYNKALTGYRIHNNSVVQKHLPQDSSIKKRLVVEFKDVISQLDAFVHYKNLRNEDKEFIEVLQSSLKAKEYKFSLSLFKLVNKHYQTLFPFLKKRTGLSRINFAYKFSKKLTAKT